MIKDLIGLAGQLNWERLIVLVLVFVLGVGATLIYEAQTHHFELSRINQAAIILSQLNDIRSKSAGGETTKEIIILDSLYKQLDAISRPTEFDVLIKTGYLKFSFAFFPWLLMSLIYLSSSDGKERRSWIGFFGAIVFGAVFGAIGAILPKFLWPWGNLLLYPFGFFLVTIALFARFGARPSI
jgi:predicted tellurium resistance membrane protein TerC